jgi:hypothetical protein|tara:strand:+ start:399 stop:569 length:171 start_codon:yes stop_codon:yes gene_type:complete
MKITEEEHRVYSSYQCGWIGGVGFLSQQRCYEILNEMGTRKDTRSSQQGHYYRIKW